jgi:hypothetical protein
LRIPNHFPTNLLVSSMFHDFHPGPVPGRWRKFSAVARQDLGFFYAISLEASRRNGTEFLTEKFKKNVMLK